MDERARPQHVAAGLVGAAIIVLFALAMLGLVVATAMDVGWSWGLLALIALPIGLFVGHRFYVWSQGKRNSSRGGPAAGASIAAVGFLIAHSSPVARLVCVGLLVGSLWALAGPIFAPALRAVRIYLLGRMWRDV